MLKGILNYAHYLLEESINKGETVIDATCGNGNDTLFLSNVVGQTGHVLAFDIQEKAINTTKRLIIDNDRTNVSLIHDSHATVSHYIPKELHGKIGGAIFNLGYLPKSDKTVITKGESTTDAIDSILSCLKKDGLIVIVVYHGHDGGRQEKESVLKHVVHLDQKEFNVLQYGFINQKNDPPFILAVQKRK
ncbi:16S rRNA (cytosine(1402)-N(4))-methyltransferase [Virgibacillus profundi]|uniref:16S rRNA (Cytosine(1402)-N(4))-methyltransferase n=1 Tax=Virgibacillus profundi TaxID=2024555 RepID=A0A2A2I7T5_9BACI|nr:class I SAM-dependent methyltransferase [Virgibacillus profundi]PAV27717.1 16S rRNA (cytosine(1402)-N(4))-methyltransferase [Virgibacillus profundi]PXY51872.1 methyltransferase domain-containing protein [Virgibacillus profundi]